MELLDKVDVIKNIDHTDIEAEKLLKTLGNERKILYLAVNGTENL